MNQNKLLKIHTLIFSLKREIKISGEQEDYYWMQIAWVLTRKGQALEDRFMESITFAVEKHLLAHSTQRVCMEKERT